MMILLRDLPKDFLRKFFGEEMEGVRETQTPWWVSSVQVDVLRAAKIGLRAARNTVETYDKKSYDKKSRSSIFDLWMLELSIFDLKIGFLVENCRYKQPKHGK